MARIVRKRLQQLDSHTTNALITVLIIAKTEPNNFLFKDTAEFRAVITYTVRDSKQHIVNCKCWGSKEKILDYHNKMKIGDVIDIICPRVFQLDHAEQKEQKTPQQRFIPQTTLPIALVLNEGEGFLDKHNYRDVSIYQKLRNLIQISHKPLNSVLHLADVQFWLINMLQHFYCVLQILFPHLAFYTVTYAFCCYSRMFCDMFIFIILTILGVSITCTYVIYVLELT